MTDISVVIPVYGCRAALEGLCDRLVKTLTGMKKTYEIILVNDSCPQNSWEIIEKLCAENEHIIGIELSRNFGQIQAITAGLDRSIGEWVVVMDCDLQDRPEEIVNLYNKVIEGYDAVFAKRKDRKDSFLKVLVSKVFYKIYSFASDGYYNPEICNFSISKRIVIDSYCRMRELHRAFVIYVKWVGFKQTDIYVQHDARKEGRSSYNAKKRIKMASEILMSQSDKLLRMTVTVGFAITGLSLLYLVYLVIHYFTAPNDIQMGWTSVVGSIFLMGGMLMICIGVVGIYVGNIFMQTKQRPLYIVRTVLNNNKDK